MIQRRVGLIAITGLVLLAGCSSDPDSETSDDPGSQPSGDDAPHADQERTIDELTRLTAQVDDAIVRIAQECMEDQGFTVHPDSGDLLPGDDSALADVVVISPDTVDASETGYGIGGHDDEAPPEPVGEFERLPQEEQDRYHEVMNGAAEGEPGGVGEDGRPALKGCYGEARLAVFPDQGRGPANPLQNLQISNESINARPEVTSALDDWQACVADAGYPTLADPADAYRYAEYFHYPVGARPGGPVPEGGPWPFDEAREREIELATVDAECADQTGLRQLQREAADAVLEETLADIEPQLAGFHSEMNQALERAQETLEES